MQPGLYDWLITLTLAWDPNLQAANILENEKENTTVTSASKWNTEHWPSTYSSLRQA